MTERITEYILIFGPAQTVVKQVNERIKEGYEPFGAPFLSTPTYSYGINLCQVMVKKVREQIPEH